MAANSILGCFGENATGEFSLKTFLADFCGQNTDPTFSRAPAKAINNELNLDQGF